MTTPTCWACGSPWFEPDGYGTLRCCDCDADYSDKPESRRISADDPESVHIYDGTPFEGKADGCRHCSMPDRVDIHAPYTRQRRNDRIICWYECHRGHRWTRSFLEPRTALPPGDIGRPVKGERAGVYFILGGDHIKIGVSATVHKRFDALRTASPVELRLIGVQPGGRELERSLHERFARHRMRGEWFRASPEIFRYIEEHCALAVN